MIDNNEIANLENAIHAAVKQTSLITLLTLTSCETLPGFSITDILESNAVYAKALETIEKLKSTTL